VSWFSRRRSCQKRNNPPGTAATLNNKLVGVTAGLGTCSTLSWIGSNNTAPDTPAGVVTSASTNAQTAPTGHSQGTRCSYVKAIVVDGVLQWMVTERTGRGSGVWDMRCQTCRARWRLRHR
jgi:hypothetical protein